MYVKPITLSAEVLTSLNKYSKVITTGDFNAHNWEWGNHYNNGKGGNLLKMINDTNFTVIHKKEHTFMNLDPKKNTAIDLTIATITVAPDIKRTVFYISIGKNGHKIIFTQINTIKSSPYQRYIYNRKKYIRKLLYCRAMKTRI